MKRSLLFLLLCLLLPAAARAGEMTGTEADSLFRDANRAYREGRFEDAAAGYERIRSAGLLSGELLYNLGNAYFQTDELGRSMANYRRASRFLPRDDDLRANRTLLEERILDRSILQNGLPLLRLLRSAVEALTPREWFIAAEILYGALFLLLALSLLSPGLRPPLRTPVRAAAVLFAIALLGAFWTGFEENARERGVILAGEVSVRSGPGERFTEEFLLHEGTTVTIQREAEGWVLLSVSTDLKGWAPASSLEKI